MAAIGFPRVHIFTDAKAAPVASSVFGKSKGTNKTTRIAFLTPPLNTPAYHVAASLTSPSCCSSSRYLEIQVVNTSGKSFPVWVNVNSFQKRFATPEGFSLLRRYFPEAAKKVPARIIYPAFAPSSAISQKRTQVKMLSVPREHEDAVKLLPTLPHVAPPLPLIDKTPIVPPQVENALLEHHLFTEREKTLLYIAFLKAAATSVEEPSFLDRKVHHIARDVILYGKNGYVLFDNYRQEDSLVGRGSFKYVYHTINLLDGTSYAVSECVCDTSKKQTICRREAAFSRQLSKIAHVAKLILYLEHDRTSYFIAPLYEGRTITHELEKARASSSSISTYQKLRWFEAILGAVLEMHKEGVLHRDLKPDNIFLDRNHQPFVGDFGLSCREDERGTYGPYALCGTRSYLAPELWQEFPKATRATDIWALGILLHEMISPLRLPWCEKLASLPQDAPFATVVAQIAPMLPSSSSWAPPFPEERFLEPEYASIELPLQVFITRLLSIDPETRLKNDHLQELREIIALSSRGRAVVDSS